jgi:hypothetical protein
VSRRRKIVLTVLAPVVLLFGAASLWQSGRPDNRYAHVLLLDPKTGDTLHRQIVDGGYAVAALLARGRVAVATADSCPDGKGGSITVFDATLQHVIRKRSIPPCTVARLDAGGLRKLLAEEPGPPAEYGRTMTVELGAGKVVESADESASLGLLNRLTAYDRAGGTVWTRADFGGHLGGVDARDGRIAVTALGEFTPGSD